jgi:hypothetical protein
MNLVKEILGSVANVQIFAIISMILFIVVFVMMLLHTYGIRKDEIREYSQMPLEDDEEEPHEE